jgi:transcription initiation factor IIE alpha subunit
MDTVECPGCLQQFDPAVMNDRMLGIQIRSDQEETTWSSDYCPACGKRVRKMDPEELLNDLEALVRHRLVMEDLAKIGKMK